MNGIARIFVRRFSSTLSLSNYPSVCIVGSGPAGFYTAQKLLKGHPEIKVDIYEKLPVPFGLVRYGIAPDHPEVKNCINTFTEAAKNERFSFFGSIAIGKDITLSQLKESYDAVVLAYGAGRDRLLNIPGENLPNVLSARRFVGWYNGLPQDAGLDVNLDLDDVLVIGHGNVALDVARILLSPIDLLKKTDIPEPVLEQLTRSRVKKVTMIGRRRPQDVAFTIKELREMIKLKGCRTSFRKEDFESLVEVIPSSSRPRKRLMELLYQTAVSPTPEQLEDWRRAEKEWALRFLLSPVEIVPTEDWKSIKGIQFTGNRMEGDKAVPTDHSEFLRCGLVLRSIGYTSLSIDPSIQFDDRLGIIPNEGGRVTGQEGVYVSGWVGTGPVGVIQATMQSGFSTGKLILSDIESGLIDVGKGKEGKKRVIQILGQKQIRPVSFKDWSTLDRFEIEEGRKFGKPREKVTDEQKMVQIAHGDQ